MGANERKMMTFGFPRMHKEPGERRDFLPSFVQKLVELDCHVYVERGIGSGMGYSDEDYAAISERVHVVDNATAFAQDVVIVLRAPEFEEFSKLKRGATLISMLHFPTRPTRVRRLKELGLEAISLDSIADDEGRRLVENTRAVGWNGLDAAFEVLEKNYEHFQDPSRPPVRVTVMGLGLVGKHAVEAASKYGNPERSEKYSEQGLAGIEVAAVGRNLTGRWDYMRDRFLVTDVLVDATGRRDPSKPVIPNDWLAWLPEHAVICDLVVDPYLLKGDPPTVRSIEGIPQGNLDKIHFEPDDPDWDKTVPREIPSKHRRSVVSCYSWPGIHPEKCMGLYGRQLFPLVQTLVEKGGVKNLHPDGGFFERALRRASLRAWL